MINNVTLHFGYIVACKQSMSFEFAQNFPELYQPAVVVAIVKNNIKKKQKREIFIVKGVFTVNLQTKVTLVRAKIGKPSVGDWLNPHEDAIFTPHDWGMVYIYIYIAAIKMVMTGGWLTLFYPHYKFLYVFVAKNVFLGFS